MVRSIADRNVESDDEDGEDGEGEVVGLARKCLELLNLDSRQGSKRDSPQQAKMLVDG